jgi:hypothetical protein
MKKEGDKDGGHPKPKIGVLKSMALIWHPVE